jgi:hypothetical protein
MLNYVNLIILLLFGLNEAIVIKIIIWIINLISLIIRNHLFF